MKLNEFDIIAAALSVSGLGAKALQSIFPASYDLSCLPDLDDLDAMISELASRKSRIKYSGRESLLLPIEESRLLREAHLGLGIHNLTWCSPEYPDRFLELNAPPPLLYAQGELTLIANNQPTIALIGTREPVQYISRSMRQIAGRCVQGGMVIVSGLAMGCDASAHEGCLAHGGQTIAILPSGVGDVYPPQHQKLAETIIESRGLLVSEYPEGTPIKDYMFVARDRLVAALSDGVICGQAGRDGGSMHTCGFSTDLGRPLAVLPPRPEGDFEGNQTLINVGSASILTDQSDLKDFLTEIQNVNSTRFVGEQ
jgi:DNA processing protein